MDDILLNLYVLIVFAILGAAGFVFYRRSVSARKQELQQFAESAGWRIEYIHEPLAKGVRLLSDNWVLEAVSTSRGVSSGPGSSSISATTTLTSRAAGSTVLCGPVSSQADLGGLGEVLARKVLQAALGDTAGNVEKVSIGDSAFQQRCLVWAQSPEDARNLINPQVQAALMAWTKTAPVIKRTLDGLSVTIEGEHLKRIDDLQQFIQLGESLLER